MGSRTPHKAATQGTPYKDWKQEREADPEYGEKLDKKLATVKREREVERILLTKSVRGTPLTPEEAKDVKWRRQQREKDLLALAKAEAKKELIPQLQALKVEVLSALANEAPIDPMTGERDFSGLKTSRVNLILRTIESFEDRTLGKPTSHSQVSQTNVNLVGELAALKDVIEGREAPRAGRNGGE